MASRRKSTTPCMVPAQDGADPGAVDPQDGAGGVASPRAEAGEDSMAEGGYECKYCSFQTSELNLFTMHVDAEHPDVVLNTSYVCVECDYHTRSYDTLLAHNARLHPGEDNFTRTMVKRNNETVFQQTVNDLTFDGGFIKMEAEATAAAAAEDTARTAIALSKTPIMRIRSRPEPKKFCALKVSAGDVIKVESDEDEENKEPPALSPAPATPAGGSAAVAPRLLPLAAPLQLHAVPHNLLLSGSNMLQIKGGGGGGGGVLPPGTLAQVLTALQNQQNQNQNQNQNQTQTQLLIPISSIPTYNSTMDSNVLLVSAYNRFPYPSLSEILGLSSQTKFSEEQIKVWFSAQRLKHGVSWTPEEVDEARRRKFNGAVQTAPPTITVFPANMAAAAASSLQSIFQTCQIVGQPGLVLTQVAGNGATVPVAPPITLTVAGVPGNQPPAAEPPPSEARAEPPARCAADAAAGRPKKSKEQLAELKASYGRRHFATEAEISRLMQVTQLSKRAIKKWFSDTRYNQRNSRDQHGPPPPPPPARAARGGGAGAAVDSTATIVIDSSDDTCESSPTSGGVPASSGSAADRRVKFRHAFPDFTPQKFKEKTAQQLLLLEASFQNADTPSDEELSRLRAQTKLTRREVDAWFTERRKAPPAPKNSDGEGDAEKPSSPAERRGGGGGGRRAVKRSPEQLNVLKRTFVRTQWPSGEEYERMAADSGLPRHYIVNWFGDTRYAWKNNSLKWFYVQQAGQEDQAQNGGARTQKKSRKRFRGWSRRSRRPAPCRPCPAGGGARQGKPGTSFLKDYYLKHGFLRESDLDELVSRSSMSYQQVRDWFSQTARRAQLGSTLLGQQEEAQLGSTLLSRQEEAQLGQQEEAQLGHQEEAQLGHQEEAQPAGQQQDKHGVMEVREQGDHEGDQEEEEVQEEEEEVQQEEEEVQEEEEEVQQEEEEVQQEEVVQEEEEEEVQEEEEEVQEEEEEVQQEEEEVQQEESQGVVQSQSEEQT